MLFFQVFVVKISLIFSVSRYEKYFPQCFFLHRGPPGISRYFVNTRKKSKFFQVPCTCFFLHKIWQYLEIPGTIPGNRCIVDETDENSEDDPDAVIMKIRNATLLEWGLTLSGREEIWFDKRPQMINKVDRNKKENMMRSVLYILVE